MTNRKLLVLRSLFLVGCSVNLRKELHPQSHFPKLNTKAVILLCDWIFLVSLYVFATCGVKKEKLSSEPGL